MRRVFILLACFLAAAVFLAGCTAPPPQAEPTTTPTREMTTEPTPTPEPEPFPEALNLEEKYFYGLEGKVRDITIYKARLLPSYHYYSDEWGYFVEQTPVEGNQFLFIWIRVSYMGESVTGAPGRGYFQIADGDYNFYQYRPDTMNYLRTIDEISDDRYEQGTDLTKYGVRDGFIAYEVPALKGLADLYAHVTLSSNETTVWRLG